MLNVPSARKNPTNKPSSTRIRVFSRSSSSRRTFTLPRKVNSSFWELTAVLSKEIVSSHRATLIKLVMVRNATIDRIELNLLFLCSCLLKIESLELCFSIRDSEKS